MSVATPGSNKNAINRIIVGKRNASYKHIDRLRLWIVERTCLLTGQSLWLNTGRPMNALQKLTSHDIISSDFLDNTVWLVTKMLHIYIANNIWMDSSGELFLCLRWVYSRVYFPSCEATKWMTTKITLEWVQKQVVTSVDTLSYFLIDTMDL